jgi:NTP pyrophosphatase (non-canonical NTP hydrolase)
MVNQNYIQIIEKVLKFNQSRGWDPVPEDIAKAISIEAAELLEHFQWDVSDRMKYQQPKNWEEISQEAADVFWYLVTFCHKSGINLPEAVEKKIKHLEEKYPEKEFAGKFNSEAYYRNKAKYREGRKN